MALTKCYMDKEVHGHSIARQSSDMTKYYTDKVLHVQSSTLTK